MRCDRMEAEVTSSGQKNDLKRWAPPELTVYGDIREITKNTTDPGFQDHPVGSTEGNACSSPGACS